MCVIIVSPNGEKPSHETLVKCHTANPDGIGIAWIQGRSVHYIKGLQTVEQLETALLPLQDATFVVHFRLATVGGKDPRLSHPFPIARDSPLALTGKAKRVLFHNGHLGTWTEEILKVLAAYPVTLPYGLWSDSRALAWCAAVVGDHWLAHSTHEKLCVLSTRNYQLFGEFEKDAETGLLFSNMYWKWDLYTTASWWKSSQYSDEDWGDYEYRADQGRAHRSMPQHTRYENERSRYQRSRWPLQRSDLTPQPRDLVDAEMLTSEELRNHYSKRELDEYDMLLQEEERATQEEQANTAAIAEILSKGDS